MATFGDTKVMSNRKIFKKSRLCQMMLMGWMVGLSHECLAYTDAYWKSVTDPSCHQYIKANFIHKSYGGWDYDRINANFTARRQKHNWASFVWGLQSAGDQIFELARVKSTTKLNDPDALAVALGNMKINKQHRFLTACEGQGKGFGSASPCDHIKFYCSNNMMGAMQASLSNQRALLRNVVGGKKCEAFKNVSHEKCVQYLMGGIEAESNILKRFQTDFKEGFFNSAYSKDVVAITDDILASVAKELKSAKDMLDAAKVADQALKQKKIEVDRELMKRDQLDDRLATIDAMNACKEKLKSDYPSLYGDYGLADLNGNCTSKLPTNQNDYSNLKESVNGISRATGHTPKSEKTMLENLVRINEGMQKKIADQKNAALAGLKNMDVNGEVQACGEILKVAKKKCMAPFDGNPVLNPTSPLDNYPNIYKDLEKSKHSRVDFAPLEIFKSNCRLHHYLRNKYVNGMYIPEELNSCKDLMAASAYDYTDSPLADNSNVLITPKKTVVNRQYAIKNYGSYVDRMQPEHQVSVPGGGKKVLNLIQEDAFVAMSKSTVTLDPSGDLLRRDVADFIKSSFDKVSVNNADVLSKLKKIKSGDSGCLSQVAKWTASTLLLSSPAAPAYLMGVVKPESCDEQTQKLIADLLFSAPDMLKEVILDGTPEGADIWCRYSEAFLKDKWLNNMWHKGADFALDVAAAITSPIPPLSFTLTAINQLRALDQAYKNQAQNDRYSRFLDDAFDSGLTEESLVKNYRDQASAANANLDNQKIATAMLLLKMNKLNMASKPLAFNPGNLIKDPGSIANDYAKDFGKKLVQEIPAKTLFKMVLTDSKDDFNTIYKDYVNQAIRSEVEKVVAPSADDFRDQLLSSIQDVVKEKGK
ncbi:MAG: hypothetical protein LW628_11615 [Fimbriimonadaceae bacterium]|nr:hypothetical protein [Fimbriimonadaceae bacterium]